MSPPDLQGWPHPRDRRHRRGDAGAALWFGAEPEHSLSHAVPGWRVSGRRRHPRRYFATCRPHAANELQGLIEQLAVRVGQVPERRGLIERALGNAWLAAEVDPGLLDDLIGHSITYRIAVGPRAGQKLFTLLPLPARTPEEEGDPSGAVRAGGFSLHAGVAIAPHQLLKLERLFRYISRLPVATERLALTASDHARFALKTPYRDGTTHIVLEPLDLMARLAALVPPPRTHLTRCHGVFAPQSVISR